MKLVLSEYEFETLRKNPYLNEISHEEYDNLIQEKLKSIEPKDEEDETLSIEVQTLDKISRVEKFYLIRLFCKKFKYFKFIGE